MEFYIVSLPYATFGIEVINGIVIRTAPIAKWMEGKTIIEASKWVINKRGYILKSNL